MMAWVCDCHGRPFIHQALLLPFTPQQMGLAWEEARKIQRTYRARPGSSVFGSDPRRTHRGTLAEAVLAEHWGIWRTPYADVGEPQVNAPSDLEFGIEIRAVAHRGKFRKNPGALGGWESQQELALLLYPSKDRRKAGRGRWVLASIRYQTSHVIYWGWRLGRSIVLAPGDKLIRLPTRYPKDLIALLYPDELDDIAKLEEYVRHQKELKARRG
jgi:hypothetical protein